MNSVKNDIFKDQRLLARFILKLRFLSDTPSLIQFVAGDEDYMRVCRRIVNASAGDARVPRQFTEICRKHGLDFQVLKEKLTPVALALGLAVSSEKQSNYYKLLGISSDARKGDIKKAFRQKVRQVHPDTSGQMTDSGQDFIHLKAAYQILSDPVLRRQYDETLPDENLWQEKGHQPVSQKRHGRTKIFYQLGVLFLLMILAVFIFDFLYRQNSIFDGDYSVEHRQVQKPNAMKEGSQKTVNNRARPENTKSKRLPTASNNTRKILRTDDTSPDTSTSFDVRSLDQLSE
jgi:DnaJ-domain-containing protein 1